MTDQIAVDRKLLESCLSCCEAYYGTLDKQLKASNRGFGFIRSSLKERMVEAGDDAGLIILDLKDLLAGRTPKGRKQEYP